MTLDFSCDCYRSCGVPGMIFPMDIETGNGNETKESDDGKVLVQRCDTCEQFSDDEYAVKFLSNISGKSIGRWYDEGSDKYYHFYLKMTLAEAEAIHLKDPRGPIEDRIRTWMGQLPEDKSEDHFNLLLCAEEELRKLRKSEGNRESQVTLETLCI